ncbi:MAG: efflux RND transporter periplasmic adaptor subunit [Parcubacteria group bacterium]|jgi:HlyD family secretion protein
MNKNIFGMSLVAILVIGAIVSIFIYGNLSKRPDYSTMQVERGDITQEISLEGKIRPRDGADLGFERGGKITKLTHKVGDFVEAGTVLAHANAVDLQAQYSEAIDLAKSSEADLLQYQELYKKEKAKLDSLKKTDTANSSDKKAQKKQIEASEAQVTSQEEKVAAAYANVENAKAQIDKTVVTAPFAGVISAQDVHEGEVAQSNVPIITLASQNSYKIEAFASETDVRSLKAGDSARGNLDDRPESYFDAKITAVDPAESEINGISNYKITLSLSENISNLRSGVGANISVAIQKKNGVVAVPKDAVFEEGGKNFVYFSENGLRLKREVQTGIYGSNGNVEIISGLNAGDSIFITRSNS